MARRYAAIMALVGMTVVLRASASRAATASRRRRLGPRLDGDARRRWLVVGAIAQSHGRRSRPRPNGT